MIEHELKPLLIGQDPLKIEYLWQLMFGRSRQHGRRGIVMHAMSGIDIALWDIAGKAAGLPLYRLFGAFIDPQHTSVTPKSGGSTLGCRARAIRPKWGSLGG